MTGSSKLTLRCHIGISVYLFLKTIKSSKIALVFIAAY